MLTVTYCEIALVAVAIVAFTPLLAAEASFEVVTVTVSAPPVKLAIGEQVTFATP